MEKKDKNEQIRQNFFINNTHIGPIISRNSEAFDSSSNEEEE